MDKNSKLKTIVNKTEAISNEYRTPTLEVIAGTHNLETEQNEGFCRFMLNYEKVYWNSKLNNERSRLLDKFKLG